jgi:hypothetical protein
MAIAYTKFLSPVKRGGQRKVAAGQIYWAGKIGGQPIIALAALCTCSGRVDDESTTAASSSNTLEKICE